MALWVDKIIVSMRNRNSSESINQSNHCIGSIRVGKGPMRGPAFQSCPWNWFPCGVRDTAHNAMGSRFGFHDLGHPLTQSLSHLETLWTGVVLDPLVGMRYAVQFV